MAEKKGVAALMAWRRNVAAWHQMASAMPYGEAAMAAQWRHGGSVSNQRQHQQNGGSGEDNIKSISIGGCGGGSRGMARRGARNAACSGGAVMASCGVQHHVCGAPGGERANGDR